MADLNRCLWVDGLGQRYGKTPWELVNDDPLALAFNRSVAERCVEHEEKERGERAKKPATKAEKVLELKRMTEKFPGLEELLAAR